MEEVLKYSLSKEDYLEYYLYESSTNKKTNAKRRRNWLLLSVSFSFITTIVFIENYKNLKLPFLIVSIATIIFYPLFEKFQFKKFYATFIDDNYTNRINTECFVQFSEEYIFLKDKTGETKINKKELTEISETSKFIFIKNSTGGHLILPKYKLQDNHSGFVKIIDELSVKNNLPYFKNLNWRWKSFLNI